MSDAHVHAGQQQQSAARHSLFEEMWQGRMRALQAAGPELAQLKRAILDDAARRGVMHRIQWVEAGLPCGLWPVAPPTFELPGPDIVLQGGGSYRARR